MNQKLSTLASIAEIVSGIAVVVTLIFLVVGIQDNTEITRAAAYDRNIDSLNEWRLGIAQNEEMLRVWTAFTLNDLEGLSEEDSRRLDFILNTQWGIYEKTYYSNQYGIIGSSEWSRFESQICSNRLGREEIWHELVEIRLTEEFARYVLSLCGDNP